MNSILRLLGAAAVAVLCLPGSPAQAQQDPRFNAPTVLKPERNDVRRESNNIRNHLRSAESDLNNTRRLIDQQNLPLAEQSGVRVVQRLFWAADSLVIHPTRVGNLYGSFISDGVRRDHEKILYGKPDGLQATYQRLEAMADGIAAQMAAAGYPRMSQLMGLLKRAALGDTAAAAQLAAQIGAAPDRIEAGGPGGPGGAGFGPGGPGGGPGFGGGMPGPGVPPSSVLPGLLSGQTPISELARVWSQLTDAEKAEYLRGLTPERIAELYNQLSPAERQAMLDLLCRTDPPKCEAVKRLLGLSGGPGFGGADPNANKPGFYLNPQTGRWEPIPPGMMVDPVTGQLVPAAPAMDPNANKPGFYLNPQTGRWEPVPPGMMVGPNGQLIPSAPPVPQGYVDSQGNPVTIDPDWGFDPQTGKGVQKTYADRAGGTLLEEVEKQLIVEPNGTRRIVDLRALSWNLSVRPVGAPEQSPGVIRMTFELVDNEGNTGFTGANWSATGGATVTPMGNRAVVEFRSSADYTITVQGQTSTGGKGSAFTAAIRQRIVVN